MTNGTGMGGDQFAGIMEPVARLLLGEPNRAFSRGKELRFGSQGSLKVDLNDGIAYDFSDEKGGGVLWLVERQTGLKGAAAVEWLQQQGLFDADGEPRPVRGHQPRPGPRPPVPTTGSGIKPSVSHETPTKVIATYDYVDENGHLIFQVLRYEPKSFRQRQPYKAPGRGASRMGSTAWMTAVANGSS
jgi:hypothetical protein